MSNEIRKLITEKIHLNNRIRVIFNQYLINSIASNEDRILISPIFNFLEKMVKYDDFLVPQVVASESLFLCKEMYEFKILLDRRLK